VTAPLQLTEQLALHATAEVIEETGVGHTDTISMAVVLKTAIIKRGETLGHP
jgi:hypothetical protein